MKTIKQIADELGVSKQAVQKRISREPLYTSLSPYIQTSNNTKYIDDIGENLIKSVFLKSIGNQVTSNETATIDNLVTTLQEDIRAKNQQIADLTVELAREREHSRGMSDKLAKLTENAQTLHLGTIHQQLLPKASTAPPEAEPTKRRGLFNKLKIWNKRSI